MLFGYEEWQNDWWLSDIRRRDIRWGTLSLYLAVNEDELTSINDAGCRAFPLRSRPLRLLAASWEKAEERGASRPVGGRQSGCCRAFQR